VHAAAAADGALVLLEGAHDVADDALERGVDVVERQGGALAVAAGVDRFGGLLALDVGKEGRLANCWGTGLDGKRTISVVTGSVVGRKERPSVGCAGRRSRLRPRTKTCWSCREALSLGFHCNHCVSKDLWKKEHDWTEKHTTSAMLARLSLFSRLKQMTAAWKKVERSGPGRSPATMPGKSQSSTLTSVSSSARTLMALKSGASDGEVCGSG
jgi:hypothetical protein